MSWMVDLTRLQSKPKISIAAVNEFILQHPTWAASVIRNALGSEMYKEFCLGCENFDNCCEKLGLIKREIGSGCICNEFLNQALSDINKPQLESLFREVTAMLTL
ncbi:MAG: hypothetical protein NWF06_06585 [Candidatus Bathyarchaeota archaeon]|nr:hypothetical protein [Candidatus Bathyarchaeum sp.]